ncbi:hypothetical protein F4819DRAFT_505633 [Hypoxylon fuscum]|nr:hypothetical protein F4819DRAFT_505633 [Hypoxylon fuscum]
MDSLRILCSNAAASGALNLKGAWEYGGQVVEKLHLKRSAESLVARSTENRTANWILGAVVIIQGVIVFALIVAALLILGYTFNSIFPVLAIVEDDAPPAYTAVESKDDSEKEGFLKDKEASAVEEGPMPRSKPITSSIRSMWRLLRSTGNMGGLCRSYSYAVVQGAALSLITLVLSAIPFMPDVVAFTIASLLTVHLDIAWVHDVISHPSRNSFTYRIPAFKLAFRATALPTLVVCVVASIAEKVPLMMSAVVLGRRPDNNFDAPRSSLVLLFTAITSIFIVIPANVILVRVQASMLPKEERPILPFDSTLMFHSAEGEGKGYMSMRDAWSTFSRAAWVRLVKLYAKIIAISSVAFFFIGAIIFGEVIAIHVLSASN